MAGLDPAIHVVPPHGAERKFTTERTEITEKGNRALRALTRISVFSVANQPLLSA
jgi:hypothetical protein